MNLAFATAGIGSLLVGLVMLLLGRWRRRFAASGHARPEEPRRDLGAGVRTSVSVFLMLMGTALLVVAIGPHFGVALDLNEDQLMVGLVATLALIWLSLMAYVATIFGAQWRLISTLARQKADRDRLSDTLESFLAEQREEDMTESEFDARE